MARTTGTVKHIHQYYRRENGIWHCSGYEECTHYVPKNMPPPVGRSSMCWDCKKPFQLTPMNMVPDKPKCDACLEQDELIYQNLGEKGLLDEQPRQRGMNIHKYLEEKKKKEAKEEDQIEVIEPDEENDNEN